MTRTRVGSNIGDVFRIQQPNKTTPRSAEVLSINTAKGTADVKYASGEIVRNAPLIGGATVGGTVTLEYRGTEVYALGSGSVTGSGGVVGLAGSSTGGLTGVAPSPHDILGVHHNPLVDTASKFLATPAGASGAATMRTISASDLPGGFSGFAAPSVSVGLSPASAGTATTALRSDAKLILDQGINPIWAGTHRFDNYLQSTSYTSGVAGWQLNGAGNGEFNNIRIRGELAASVFKINEMSATAGTFGVWYSAGTVYADFTTPASVSSTGTMQAKNSDAGGMLFGVNDYVQLKSWTGAGVSSSWLRIDSRTNNTTYTTYGYTLMSGSTSATFRAGTAIADWGPTGSGAITLSADGTIGSSANMSIMTHAGSPWSTTTLVTRLGNLNGSYGVASNLYGIGLGDYSGSNYLKYDTSGGFKLQAGSGALTIDATGVAVNVSSTTWSTANSYRFTSSLATDVGLYAYDSGGTDISLGVRNIAAANKNPFTYIQAVGSGTATSAQIVINASIASGGGQITVANNGVQISSPTSGLRVGSSGAPPGSGAITAESTISVVPTAGDAVFQATGANAFYRLWENDQAANEGRWDMVAVGKQLLIRTVTDDLSSSATAMKVIRGTGTAITNVEFPQIVQFTGGSIGVQGAGSAVISMYDNGAAANEKIWDIAADNTFLYGRVLTDAYGSPVNWLQVTRSGATVSNVAFPNGRVGIGTTSPQAELHTYDTDGGTLHNWRTTGIAGTRVTIVPNGTGDCVQSCSVFGVAYDSSGNAWEVRGSLKSGQAAGVEQTVQVAGDATDNLHVKVKTDGQVEIVRNAGARTWSVCLSAWWR